MVSHMVGVLAHARYSLGASVFLFIWLAAVGRTPPGQLIRQGAPTLQRKQAHTNAKSVISVARDVASPAERTFPEALNAERLQVHDDCGWQCPRHPPVACNQLTVAGRTPPLESRGHKA